MCAFVRIDATKSDEEAGKVLAEICVANAEKQRQELARQRYRPVSKEKILQMVRPHLTDEEQLRAQMFGELEVYDIYLKDFNQRPADMPPHLRVAIN